jgi:hypothetical protein
MKKQLAAALLTASVAGAGFTGFTITSALADDDSSAETTAVQLEEGEQDGCRGNREDRAQALADTIGISVEDLTAAREAGQTPAEIAEDNGVSRDELVSALVDAKQTRLDEAVAVGDLTQEEVDEKAADLEDHVNAFVDGEGGPHGLDGRGPDADGAPDDGDAPAEDAPADDEEADA